MSYAYFTTLEDAEAHLTTQSAKGRSGYVLTLNATTYEVRTWA